MICVGHLDAAFADLLFRVIPVLVKLRHPRRDQRGSELVALAQRRGLIMTSAKHPFLDLGMEGYIVNTAKREYWRVSELCDFQDLVQDGYVCFYKCVRSYPHLSEAKNPTKDQRRHFQALVKTTFSNHISTLAAKHKGVSVKAVSQFSAAETLSENDIWDQLLPTQAEEGSLRALLISAPTEIKQLVQLLASDGLDLLGFKKYRKGRRLLRETTNEYYCRLIGKNPKELDLVGQLRSYFGS